MRLPTLIAGLSCLLLLLVGACPAPAQSGVTSGSAYVTYISGAVSVLDTNGSTWKAASLKQQVKAGDQVKTGKNSCAVLILDDKSTLKLNQSTHIKLQKIQPSGNPGIGTKITVFIGNMWTDVNSFFYQKSSFEVESGQTTAAVRGTAFDLVSEYDEVMLYGWEGKVRVASPGGETEISSFEECRVRGGVPARKPFQADAAAFTDWNGWNNYVDGVIRDHRRNDGAKLSTDITDITQELDATPDPRNFSAVVGGVMKSVPEAKTRMMDRMLCRIPPEKKGAVGSDLEKKLFSGMQNPDPWNDDFNHAVKDKSGKVKKLKDKWKKLPKVKGAQQDDSPPSQWTPPGQRKKEGKDLPPGQKKKKKNAPPGLPPAKQPRN